MTTRDGCVAATLAWAAFLLAVGFILGALLRGPEWSDGDRAALWSCYAFLVVASALCVRDAWRRR